MKRFNFRGGMRLRNRSRTLSSRYTVVLAIELCLQKCRLSMSHSTIIRCTRRGKAARGRGVGYAEPAGILNVTKDEVPLVPANDRYHDTVVRALTKDGWTVTAQQVAVAVPGRRLWIDLRATKVRDSLVVLIEVKGFEKMPARQPAYGLWCSTQSRRRSFNGYLERDVATGADWICR
ncbi:MAG: element excision factor XisH family protein [Chloroflexota bacterium]